LNPLPSGNGRTIEKVTGLEFFRAESLHRNADVLFFAARIGEAKIDEFDLFVFDGLKNFIWSHVFSFSWLSSVRWSSEMNTNNTGLSTNKKSPRPKKSAEDFTVHLPARRRTRQS